MRGGDANITCNVHNLWTVVEVTKYSMRCHSNSVNRRVILKNMSRENYSTTWILTVSLKDLETEHRIILASFPGLPRFYLPFAFTIIHGSRRPVLIFVGLPISCIIVNANGSSKRGRPGTEARIIVVLCYQKLPTVSSAVIDIARPAFSGRYGSLIVRALKSSPMSQVT